MFDAGAIQAHLDVEMSAFDRKLDQAEDRVKRFENAKHEVKISAVFDNASMGRARQMFSQLDQQLSRDAMQRLRSSPQGSILGSLNALLSPHGVTGAPSISQIAGSGNIVSRAVGGGGTSSPGLGQVLIRQAAAAGGADAGSAAAMAAATATSDAAGDLKDAADKTSRAADDTSQAARDSSTASRGLRDLFGRLGFGGGRGTGLVSAVSTAGDPNQSAFAKLIGAAGPGIGALGAKPAAIIGGGGALLAGVPALLGGLAPLIPGLLGAGVVGLGAKELIGTQNQAGQPATQGPLYNQAQALSASLKSTLQVGMSGLIGPLGQAMAQIPKLLQGLLPDIKNLFSSAATLIQPFLLGLNDLAKNILPLLAQGFRLAAPFIRPLVDGISALAGGLLQGLNQLLKAAAPAVAAVVSVLRGLGTNLGAFFADMAPALAASGVVLKALFDIIGGLLPFLVKLANVFATALAPVIVSFGGAIKALEPALIIIGKILGELAGAILGDLASAFTAIAQLVVGLSPAFTVLAKVMGQVFNALESAGVFGALSSALEQLAGPLAKFIDLLVMQLVPILPLLVTLLTQTVSIMITLAAAGLSTVLTLVTQLLTHMPFLVPLLGAIAAAWVVWNVVMSLSPMGAIIVAIVALIGAITLLATHWHQVWTDITNWAMDAWNFLTHGWGQYLVPGLTAIRLAVAFVRDNWKQAWTDMQNWAGDFWNWLHQIFGVDVGNFLTKTMPGWWDTGVQAIKGFWDQISNIVKIPTNFLIGTVYDNGIRRFWNDIIAKIPGVPSLPDVPTLAGGGRINAGTGPVADDVLIRASRGETVVSAAHSNLLAPMFAALGIPGYATGGKVGQNPPDPSSQVIPGAGSRFGPIPGVGGVASSLWNIGGKIYDAAKMTGDILTGNTTGAANALNAMIGTSGGTTGPLAQMMLGIPKAIVKGLIGLLTGVGGASASAIVDYAMQFIGKIPYVWGGTSVPGGADCSGFVQAIYEHFGIAAPRTSEAQGAWVRRTGPTPGGLAFYHSPPGGPDPGHVALIRSATQVISQGGGLGPQLMGINAMPLLWTGVPPGGFGGVVGGNVGQWLAAGLKLAGEPASWAGLMNILVGKESGGNAKAVNPISVLGQHAEGLLQMLPSTFAQYAITGFNDIFNPVDNAAASARYIAAIYGSPANISGLTSGTYYGYASGGPIMEPVIGFGTATGSRYAFAENGPEWVTPGGQQPGKAMIGNVFIQLPEGGTVAKALTDLNFWLSVARQQNYVGVLPGG